MVIEYHPHDYVCFKVKRLSTIQCAKDDHTYGELEDCGIETFSFLERTAALNCDVSSWPTRRKSCTCMGTHHLRRKCSSLNVEICETMQCLSAGTRLVYVAAAV